MCGRDFAKSVLHRGADPSRVLHQSVLEQVERRQTRGACDRVAAESAAVRPGRPAHLLRARDERAERKPGRDALGQADDVRLDTPVLDGQEVTRATHPRLDLIRDEKDAVPGGQLPQARQEVVRWNQVAALALDGLDKDRGDAFRGRDGVEQLFDTLDRLVGGHAARHRRERRMEHLREQRGEAPALARFRRRQRQGAECPAVKRPDERDIARPSGGIARELHGALDRLGAGVREEDTRRRARQDPVLQSLRQLDLRRVVEVRPGHVDEAFRLLLDRGDNLRVGVARGDDGDAGREVEEPVAVHVCDPAAPASLHDEGVGAGEARRHRLGVACDQLSGFWPWQGRLDLGLHGREA